MRIKAESKKKRISMRLLGSYLAIILAPAIAIGVIYVTMHEALVDIQKERVQNLVKEVTVTFNKEMEQIHNVAKYIISDDDLKSYMDERSTYESAENYYHAYELAKSYPDYALLNRFIGNIYIFPLETAYIIRIPQVISNDDRGIWSVDMTNAGADYGEMVQKLYNLEKNGLIFGEDIADDFLMVQRFDYEGSEEKAGMVVIKIAEKQIEELLSQTLGTDTGAAFLVDEEENILYLYDRLNDVAQKRLSDIKWQTYVEENAWVSEDVTIHQVSTEYNGWSVVTVIPNRELLSKIGAGKNVILLLCIMSVLCGVAICLWYWNRSWPVIDRYMKYTEKYSQQMEKRAKTDSLWKNFNGVFEHVDTLEVTLDNQKQWVKESVLRKLLYGMYDSKEELEQELKKAKVVLPVKFPCVLVGLEVENPMKQEASISMDEIEAALRKNMDEILPYPYLLVSMNVLNYVLLVDVHEMTEDRQELKTLFEQLNYAVYSQVPLNIFIGISKMADTLLAVAEEYEHVCRICEYAKYYKLRMPCLLEELPRHQHLVFTVELEMHLEKTIKNGTKGQLEEIMNQVLENYFDIPSMRFAPDGHNLEILRCILVRCLKKQEKDEKARLLLEKIYKDRGISEIEESIWEVWEYFQKQQEICLDQNLEQLKQMIDEKMEQEYATVDFNLAMVAEWLDIPEKKLYRDFKKMYGVSFASYLEMKRIHYAQEFLKEKRAIVDVAAAVGYSSDYSFRRAFKRVVGVTPSDYQRMQEA